MTDLDHQLMQLCGTGDADAFRRLVERWQPRVARLLERLGASRADQGLSAGDVDDLTQDVFLKVLRASRRYRASHAFSTWLYRIVINVARDAGRRRRARQDAGQNEPGERSAPATENPLDQACRQELRQQVAELLSSLPTKYREPLVLRHFGQLTFAEVAAVLRLPTSTVKSRVQSGLLRLRAELARRGITEKDVT